MASVSPASIIQRRNQCVTSWITEFLPMEFTAWWVDNNCKYRIDAESDRINMRSNLVNCDVVERFIGRRKCEP